VPAGRASDRRGALGVLLAGVLAFLGAYLIFALAGAGMVVLAMGFVLAGIGIGSVETAEHAAVAAAPADLRGSAFGVLAAVRSFGNLAASGFAGVIWSAVSPTTAFCYLASWMMTALLLLLAARRGR
jgi:MFS family permease